MSLFKANYPHPEQKLLTTAQRLNALPDYTGRGVVMAYVDSGFYMHSDIASRVLLHVDASTHRIKEQTDIPKTDVMSWHGLMTAAIGSGNGAASGGQYRSLAYDSKLVLVKVSSPQGAVKEQDILRGMRWLVANHRRFNIHIVNVSVGGDRVSDNPNHPLHRSVRKLYQAGVTVVIAAGNRGQNRLVPPASAPEAIVVGGYDDNNSPDRYMWQNYGSNYGKAHDGTTKPDVIAPARWIASPILPETAVEKEARWLGQLLEDDSQETIRHLLKNGQADLDLPVRKTKRLRSNALRDALQERIHAHKLINSHYQHVDGTSVAAPIVSSVIAQMLEANPALSPEQIRSILKETAISVTRIPPAQQGAGSVNPAEAVKAALNYPNPGV